jgi:pyrroline-5-carboxylate reductase
VFGCCKAIQIFVEEARPMRVSFIGGGVMAEAILAGILDASLTAPADVSIGEPLELRRAHLRAEYGVAAVESNAEALAGAEMVVLAVKPQGLAGVMDDIRDDLEPDQTVLSIIAGARLDTLVSGLGHSSVVRVMPNTPAQIGAGMTVWTATEDVPAESVEASREILRTLGEEIYVSDEKYIDMATAVSASGPAYVFLFIEAMIDAGVYLGMPRDTSRKLVLQTVIGSARLVDESGRHPADLKDMVTSPGGTTAEALMAFEQGGFRGIVMDAVSAAYEKSKALGEKS